MIPFPYTNKDGREFISHQPERNAEGSGNVGAFDAQTSELLGGCGFRGLEAERTEFGYWVAGRGIAPRALILLVRWVVENTVAKRLQLHADVENTATATTSHSWGSPGSRPATTAGGRAPACAAVS
ncbi:MAG: Acetyltransferase domain [Gaiellaceae bacterium]|nr:Acetyltransferase domain [Gaiellaceae bacterium]